MKNFVMTLVALSVIVSSCDYSAQRDSNSQTTQTIQTTNTQAGNFETIIVTAKAIRVGHFTIHSMYGNGFPETGTVIIFENGHVFKERDEKGSFACAVKEGDIVTYKKFPDGRVALISFVVPKN